MRYVRLVLAGLFVFAALIAAVTAAERRWGDEGMRGFEWLVAPFLIATLYAAFKLFNRPGERSLAKDLGRWDPEAEVRRLDEAGQLTRREFRVRRAFELEETEDEGFSFVCELEDGRSLLLRGQFLYYVVWPDPFALRRFERRFPCTRFHVCEDANGTAVWIEREGEVLAIECVAPPFDLGELEEQDLFDGDVTVLERRYEELKTLLVERRPLPAEARIH
jgi:hypothetical protein